MQPQPRHARASTDPRRLVPWRRAGSAARPLAGGAIGVAAATALVAVGGATDTLALWNQAAAIPGPSITAAGVDLSVAAGTAPGPRGQVDVPLPDGTWAGMLPGDVVGTEFTVTNHRDGPARLTAALDETAAASTSVTVRLAPGTCQGSTPAGTVLTADPTDVLGATLAPRTPTTFCQQVALSTTTPASYQGRVVLPVFTVTLAGTPEVS